MTTPPKQSLDEILLKLAKHFIENGHKAGDIFIYPEEVSESRDLTEARAAILAWCRAQRPEAKKTLPGLGDDTTTYTWAYREALDAYEAKFSNSEEETDG